MKKTVTIVLTMDLTGMAGADLPAERAKFAATMAEGAIQNRLFGNGFLPKDIEVASWQVTACQDANASEAVRLHDRLTAAAMMARSALETIEGACPKDLLRNPIKDAVRSAQTGIARIMREIWPSDQWNAAIAACNEALLVKRDALMATDHKNTGGVELAASIVRSLKRE